MYAHYRVTSTHVRCKWHLTPLKKYIILETLKKNVEGIVFEW